MKLSQIFSRKTSKLDIESIADPSDIPGADSCNCANILPGPIPHDVKHDLTSGNINDDTEGSLPFSRERGKVYHKFIANQIMGLMNEEDPVKRSENSKILDKIIPASGEPQHRSLAFMDHLLSHVQRGGMSHRDIGLSDHEMNNFRAAKEGLEYQANAKRDGAVQSYPTINCADCESHRQKLNDNIVKHQADLPGKTVGEVSKDTYEHWRGGGTADRTTEPKLHAIHKSLSNWDAHLQAEHKISFGDVDPKVSISIDKSSTEPSEHVSRIYDNLLGLSSGWDFKNREDVPHGVSKMVQPRPNEDDDAYDYRTKGYDDSIPHREYKLPSSIQPRKIDYPATPHTPEEQLNGDTETRSTTQRNDPGGRTKTVVEMPWGTVEGYEHPGDGFTHYTKERISNDKDVSYDRSKDPRTGLYEGPASLDEAPEIVDPKYNIGAIPRVHRYLFQKTGVEPKVQGLKDYQTALWHHENQPRFTHVDTGQTETVPGSPIMENKQFIDRDGQHLPFEDTYKSESNEAWENLKRSDPHVPTMINKYNQWKNDWHESNKPFNKYVPKLNETGAPVLSDPVVKKVYNRVPIPEEHLIAKPSSEQLGHAQNEYNDSFDTALTKAYPGMERNDAINALHEEHAGVVNNLKENKTKSMKNMNRRVEAKKEIIMPTFNSNGKEANSSISTLALGELAGGGLAAVGLSMLKDKINGQGQGKHLAPNLLKSRQEAWSAMPELGRGLATDVYGPTANPHHQDHDLNDNYDGLFDKKSSKAASILSIAAVKLAEDKKPCKTCGKHCKDKDECKTNVDERRRQQSADSAW